MSEQYPYDVKKCGDCVHFVEDPEFPEAGGYCPYHGITDYAWQACEKYFRPIHETIEDIFEPVKKENVFDNPLDKFKKAGE